MKGGCKTIELVITTPKFNGYIILFLLKIFIKYAFFSQNLVLADYKTHPF